MERIMRYKSVVVGVILLCGLWFGDHSQDAFSHSADTVQRYTQNCDKGKDASCM